MSLLANVACAEVTRRASERHLQSNACLASHAWLASTAQWIRAAQDRSALLYLRQAGSCIAAGAQATLPLHLCKADVAHGGERGRRATAAAKCGAVRCAGARARSLVQWDVSRNAVLRKPAAQALRRAQNAAVDLFNNEKRKQCGKRCICLRVACGHVSCSTAVLAFCGSPGTTRAD